MSESLFGLLVALSLLAAYRLVESASVGRALLLGTLVGLAALTRSEALIFLPLVLIPVLRVPRGGRAALVALLAFAVVLTPWTVRNWIVFDQPVIISTNSGSAVAGANCHETYYGDQLGGWRPQCIRETPGNEAKHQDDGARRRRALCPPPPGPPAPGPDGAPCTGMEPLRPAAAPGGTLRARGEARGADVLRARAAGGGWSTRPAAPAGGRLDSAHTVHRRVLHRADHLRQPALSRARRARRSSCSRPWPSTRCCAVAGPPEPGRRRPRSTSGAAGSRGDCAR